MDYCNLEVVLLNLKINLLTDIVLSKGSLKCPKRLFYDIFFTILIRLLSTQKHKGFGEIKSKSIQDKF